MDLGEHSTSWRSMNVPGVAGFAALGGFALMLRYLHGVPWGATTAFVIACYALLYCPGRVVLHSVGLAVAPATELVLALLAGLSLMTGVYQLARLAGAPWVIPGVAIPATGYVLWTDVRRRLHARNIPRRPPPRGLLVAVLALGVLAAGLHVSHFSDLRLQPDGGVLLRNHHMTESAFHLGLMNMAKSAVPPPYPYASGYALPYHAGIHLLGEMLSRFAGIDTLLATYFFLPALFLALLLAAAGVFFFDLVPHVGLAAAFALMMLGADFSFVPGIVLGFPADVPWTLFFRTTIWSLFTLNGLLPAVPMMFGAFLLFRRYARGQPSSLALLVLLSLGAFQVKSSMGLQLLACGLVVSLWFLQRERSPRWRNASLAFFLGGLIVVGDLALRGKPTEVVTRLTLAPFGGFRRTLESVAGAIPGLPTTASPGWLGIALLPLFLAYVVGFLGVRAVGFCYAYDAFRARKMPPPFESFLFLFCLGGLVVGETLHLGGADGINNADWFAVQSVLAATTYFGLWFSGAWLGGKRALAVAVCVIGLAPTTLNFLALRSGGSYVEIGPDVLATARFLERSTPPGAVVLELIENGYPSIAAQFAGRRTVLGTHRSFLRSTVGREELDRRFAALSAYFGGAPVEDRDRVLDEFGVNYVVVPNAWYQLIHGQRRLTPVFRNASLTVLSVGPGVTGGQ
ncbi:MAG: hypothetical protein WB493_00215 [Anaeromyxobacteraceae bacterium]